MGEDEREPWLQQDEGHRQHGDRKRRAPDPGQGRDVLHLHRKPEGAECTPDEGYHGHGQVYRAVPGHRRGRDVRGEGGEQKGPGLASDTTAGTSEDSADELLEGVWRLGKVEPLPARQPRSGEETQRF